MAFTYLKHKCYFQSSNFIFTYVQSEYHRWHKLQSKVLRIILYKRTHTLLYGTVGRRVVDSSLVFPQMPSQSLLKRQDNSIHTVDNAAMAMPGEKYNDHLNICFPYFSQLDSFSFVASWELASVVRQYQVTIECKNKSKALLLENAIIVTRVK